MDPWPFIPEADLVPYGCIEVDAPRGLLVLAPHPDDEVFGCGGLVARACDRGLPVRVIVLTDGSAAGDAGVRQRESLLAARALAGAAPPPVLEFWRHRDRGLQPDAALVARLAAAIDRMRPSWLLAPSPFEVHPDHRATCVAAIEAAAGHDLQLGFYEVGQPLLAGAFVDIGPVMARKRAAMSVFASQNAVQRYDQQVEALNRLRAYTLGPGVVHAEALWFPADPARRTVAGVLAELHQRLARRLGL